MLCIQIETEAVCYMNFHIMGLYKNKPMMMDVQDGKRKISIGIAQRCYY